jgi:hypothetical protein
MIHLLELHGPLLLAGPAPWEHHKRYHVFLLSHIELEQTKEIAFCYKFQKRRKPLWGRQKVYNLAKLWNAEREFEHLKPRQTEKEQKAAKSKWEIHRANVENESENAVSTTRGWNLDKKRSSLQKPGSRQDDKVVTNSIIRSLKLQWQDAEHILDYIQKAYSDEVASVLAIRTVIVVRVSSHFVVSSHI